MIASRGNVILAFLRIYLIFGILTTFVFSENNFEWTIDKEKVFQKAGCIAACLKDVSVLC